jgi:hypothetical protein
VEDFLRSFQAKRFFLVLLFFSKKCTFSATGMEVNKNKHKSTTRVQKTVNGAYFVIIIFKILLLVPVVKLFHLILTDWYIRLVSVNFNFLQTPWQKRFKFRPLKFKVWTIFAPIKSVPIFDFQHIYFIV